MLRAKYSEYSHTDSHRLEQCDEAWRRLSHPDNAGLCWAEALAHSGRRPSPERRSFAGGTMNIGSLSFASSFVRVSRLGRSTDSAEA